MAINTDLNVTPYFDDYDEDKKFHRVLFRPSVPVQARELTQSQTILQNQIERFGDHVFQSGTIIKGCSFNYQTINYLKLNDANTSSSALVMSEFSDTYVRTSSANLIAQVHEVKSGFEATNPDLNTIWFDYTTTGSSGGSQVTEFSAGETLEVYNINASINAVTLSANTGTAYSNADTITFSSTFGTNATANLTTNSTGGITSTSFNNTASQGHSYRITDLPTVANITTSTGSTANLELFVMALTKKNTVTIANTSFEDSGGNVEFNSLGGGVRFLVDDGLIYQKGHFSQVSAQSIIVKDYVANAHGQAIGFDTTESIVNNTVDTSLNDNASGFLNENAPGAYRLKLTPTLVVNTITNAESTNNFFILVRYGDDGPVISKEETEYSQLGDRFAKRTKEESGDYVVKPFTIKSEAISGNTTHFNTVLSPGSAYVDGYAVTTVGTSRLDTSKATNTKNVSSAIVTSNYGNYQLVDELVGHFAFNYAAEVKLLDGAGNRISSSLGSSIPTVPTTSNSTVITGTSPSFTGNILGTAKVRSVLYENNTPGTPTGQYRLYLFDISMNQGKRYQDVRSIWYSAEGIADVTLDANSAASIKESDFKTLTQPIGRDGIKTISINGIANNQYIYRTAKTDGTVAVNGTIIITTTGTETFPYTASAYLNTTQEQDFIVVANNDSAQTVALTGTAAVTSGQGNVTGTSTLFTTEYVVGDFIKVADANTHRVTSIVSNTVMVTANNFGVGVSGKEHRRFFPTDLPVNLFDRTTSNVEIGSDSNTATLNISGGKTLEDTLTAHVYYPVKKTSAPPISKTLATSFVKVNCASHSTTTTPPYSLGITDVYDALAIYVGNNVWWDGTTAANSTVVDKTTNFVVTSGQKDGFYGLGKIGANTSNSITLISTDRIVAKVRHFKKDTSGGGAGFFNIDSYPVNDTTANSTNEYIKTEEIPIYTSPVDGQSIDLRNSVDFRPVVANTADDTATAASGATINPTGTEAFAASDHKIAGPNENFTFDYQYYLPRIDRIFISSDGIPEIQEGIAAEIPLAPRDKDGAMSLGIMDVPVYPTLSSSQARVAKRPDYGVRITAKQQRNYTMKDIGQIEKRINRLEYYSSLNLLEKQTNDLVIPAESNNAVDRFKQGFLVDAFNNLSIAATQDGEYKAGINKTENTLIPKFKQNKVDLEITSHSDTQLTGDLITLPYTHVEFLKQRYATSARNLETVNWRFDGDMDLYPNYDNYYEVRNPPENDVNIDIDLASPTLSLIDKLNEIQSLQEPRTDIVGDSTTSQVIKSGVSQRSSQSGRTVTTTTVQTDTLEHTRNITEQQTRALFTGDTSTTKQNVGEFVTDISFSPYIREQNIYFHCFGLRPNARHYAFFDHTNMDANTRPATVPDAQTISRSNFQPTGVLGSNLVSSNTGDLFGIMHVPQQTFAVGERAVLIADVDTFSDAADQAVSAAETPFNAYNFGTDKKDLTVSTRSAVVSRPRTFFGICSRSEKSISQVEKTVGVSVTTLPPPPSPPPPTRTQRSYPMGGGAARRGVCFIAGTQIIMEDHSLKNIEDVQVGDRVHRLDAGSNKVLDLQHTTTKGRRLVSINGEDHFFTEDHPIKTNNGWRTANAEMARELSDHIDLDITELTVGDIIIGHAGDETRVDYYNVKQVPEDTPVYNFGLDGDHLYFANGFCVHNRCFRAGTKVIVGNGDLKLIEDVEVGEELIGRDGMVNEVIELHRPTLSSTNGIAPHTQRMISINGGGFDTSEDHMFMTTEGWRAPCAECCKAVHVKVLEDEGVDNMQDLQVGDNIITPNGTVEVTSIDFKDDDPDLQLYNFILSGNRTYHVVMGGHDEPLLVHNKAGCFIAGTEMTMEDHSKKKVEDVEIGDRLHGQGDKINKVEELLHPVTGGRKLVSINGGDYFCTEDHPFMTSDGGWKAANGEMAKERYPQLNVGQLGVGDTIEGHLDHSPIVRDGRHLDQGILVESIDTKEVPEDTPLYNFRLDGDHTYIAANHLMHNKCCWVARKIYGAYNPDWLIFRTWLLTEAPKWLFKTYLYHGEKFAKWLDGKDTLQKIIRRLMDRKVQYMMIKKGSIR